jgi:hypothetical protein
MFHSHSFSFTPPLFSVFLSFGRHLFLRVFISFASFFPFNFLASIHLRKAAGGTVL